jgi:type IV pilus assembly protein PilB
MAELKTNLGRKLLESGLITAAQLDSAREAQRLNPLPLTAVLVQLGYVPESVLMSFLAREAGVSLWDGHVSASAASLVSGEICRRHLLLPVKVDGEKLLVAMADPDDVEAIDVVRYATRLRVEPLLGSPAKLQAQIERAFGGSESGSGVQDLVTSAEAERTLAEQLRAEVEEDTPLVSFVNEIISEAVREQASDIHLEPRLGRLEVRYRIDGRLRRIREVPASLQPMMVARIKIISDLDISESRLPQDGRAAFRFDGRQIDLRVSITPSHHGQRVVIRILDRFASIRRLEEVGFTEQNLGLFRDLINQPHGILLVTGPTGSGKTTTLYGALSELNDEATNIMTVEDPIEYEIDGVNQTQVNERIGLGFAAQLRSMLRQDPDVILVGEIRDRETAETAIRASLTGHLVLSTLHTNDAVSAIPRLLDMGIDAYMLGTSLIGVVSQRLVRVLCIGCMAARDTSEKERALWTQAGCAAPGKVPVAVGCPMCGGMGYKGRVAVHEVLEISAALSQMIANRSPLPEVRREALQAGFRPIHQHALQLIEEGMTSLEEVRKKVKFVAS